jgi:DNA polymerase zeta
MPCVDVADAIVQTARETLEAAMRLVQGGRFPGCRVVYGDTDSIFVLCEGATRDRAFALGRYLHLPLHLPPSPCSPPLYLGRSPRL